MQANTEQFKGRTVSCGCCTDGCVCWMHRRTTPAIGQKLPQCAYHAEHGHPHITSPIAKAWSANPDDARLERDHF